MLIVWNPNAGKVNQAEDLYNRLAARPDIDVCATASVEEATQLVSSRIHSGERRVVAAGGDGTINAVLNGVMRRPHGVTLGVLPLGTANDWCASLAVPDDLDEGWQLIERDQGKLVDVVELQTPATQTYFANIATGGNSHRVTESITDEMKQAWGSLCYLRGAIGILSDLQTFRTAISFDGGPDESFDVWNIIVANGKTSAGRLEVAPKSKLDDGLLDVVIIRDGTLLDVAGIAAKSLTSTYIESDQIEYRQAKSIRIRSEPPLLFSIDGDMVDQQPVEFRICPDALRVIVGDDYG